MKIAVLAAGTRGDIDPFLALALGLREAGHEVGVWTPPQLHSRVRRLGLRPAPGSNAAGPDGAGPESGERFEPLRPSRDSLLRYRLEGNLEVFHRMMEDHWSACRDVDLVVYHGNLFSVPMICEARTLPRVAVLQAPILTPTRAFPCPLYEGEARSAEESWASYGRVLSELSARIWPLVQAWRDRRLGLRPLNDGENPFLARDALPSPILYCSSPALFGRPRDWPETAEATGFWLLDDPDEASLGPELEEFLETGSPPVYIGFGSMRRSGARELSLQLASILERLGLRGILATGWGGLGRIQNRPHVHCLGKTSHRRLFPRVGAVVHHGGASTTGAGLAAGRPSWILPFLADQPFWGRCVHQLGLGPAPVAQSRLDEGTLIAGLEAVARRVSFRESSETMGERLRREDGVGEAVRLVESYASGS